MIRVVILDQGKTLSAKDLATGPQLRAAIDQARSLITECERLLKNFEGEQKGPHQGGIPYLS